MIEIHRDDDTTRDALEKGNSLLLRGDYPGALAVYQGVVAAHRDNVEAAVGVAVTLHKMRRLDEAAKAYRRALDLEPGNVNALGGLLTILTQSEPSSALPQLLDLAHEHPYDAPLLAQLANAYAETGATDDALRWMREAVRISPDNPYYRLNLAVLLDRSNDGSDAAVEYQNYLRLVSMSGDVGANRDEITRVNTRLNYLRAASLKP